ncbi:hypothetical protein AD930_12915 [Acetobacter malorum]|nr:hypothetical protein AD930_12915 [Acetobacter malorum]
MFFCSSVGFWLFQSDTRFLKNPDSFGLKAGQERDIIVGRLFWQGRNSGFLPPEMRLFSLSRGTFSSQMKARYRNFICTLRYAYEIAGFFLLFSRSIAFKNALSQLIVLK